MNLNDYYEYYDILFDLITGKNLVAIYNVLPTTV